MFFFVFFFCNSFKSTACVVCIWLLFFLKWNLKFAWSSRNDGPVPDEFITEASYRTLTTFPSFKERFQNLPHSQLRTNIPKHMPCSLETLNLIGPAQKLSGLDSLKPGFKFPHYSQLTEGLVRYYIFLRSQYGIQGKRVDTNAEAKQYKHWMVSTTLAYWSGKTKFSAVTLCFKLSP